MRGGLFMASHDDIDFRTMTINGVKYWTQLAAWNPKKIPCVFTAEVLNYEVSPSHF
jgi:hypothetical protein